MRAAIAVLAALVATAHADVNLGAVAPGTSVVSARTGQDYGVIVGVGYARAVDVVDRALLVGVDASAVLANMAGDTQVRISATLPIVGRGPWRLFGAVGATGRTARNPVADMVGFAGDVSLLAGRFSARWFAAAEVGADIALATYIAHTSEYRMAAFPDARDGWYRATGVNLQYGVQGGMTFGRCDAILRLGKLGDVEGGAPLIPIYGTFAVAVRF